MQAGFGLAGGLCLIRSLYLPCGVHLTRGLGLTRPHAGKAENQNDQHPSLCFPFADQKIYAESRPRQAEACQNGQCLNRRCVSGLKDPSSRLVSPLAKPVFYRVGAGNPSNNRRNLKVVHHRISRGLPFFVHSKCISGC